LALVLTLALIWYSLNPAPRPLKRIKREDEQPDEKKREAEPQLRATALLPLMPGRGVAGLKDSSAPTKEEDDFEWPEFIDG
jgi:hypothetical protein